ncbi:MAG: hypothetical protein OXK77_15400 [Gemmatimonadota bacterium]|nr:hypothetical protein [Gemmatimonadota bacterium]MDE2866966.1 hypothetical protein [Gemmatimonadota bacterium]MXV96924.1 hypothetical protein [Gemmatimonadota bacterium]MYB08163.1 hypothetical protein [Gemmatimonadota bacterium]MYE15359.1 hypothetical protein [Gemmatimonadota bacterium]
MDAFTARQKRHLLDQVADGIASPRCPRCRGPCAVIHTGPRGDVAYVRDRVLVRCSRCLRSCAIEARELGG